MSEVSVVIPNYYIRIMYCIVMQLVPKRWRFQTFSERIGKNLTRG